MYMQHPIVDQDSNRRMPRTQSHRLLTAVCGNVCARGGADVIGVRARQREAGAWGRGGGGLGPGVVGPAPGWGWGGAAPSVRRASHPSVCSCAAAACAAQVPPIARSYRVILSQLLTYSAPIAYQVRAAGRSTGAWWLVRCLSGAADSFGRKHGYCTVQYPDRKRNVERQDS